MVGLQTLDLAIGVRVPASQPTYDCELRAVSSRSLYDLNYMFATTEGLWFH